MSKKALIISCFNWYKTRLRPVRELLLVRKYDVTVLIADFEHITLSPVEIRYPECTYVSVPQYKMNISLQRIRSHLNFGKKVNYWIEQNRPDLIYCQVPPNNVAKYCYKYKRLHRDTKLILDIIDLWPESIPVGRKLKSMLPMKVWKRWRDDAIVSADYVFTECNLYQEKLKDYLNPKKTSTLYLFKEQSDEERNLISAIIREKEQNVSDNHNVIKFAYLGSMNSIIDIDGICSVITQFQKDGYFCELHAIGDGESRKKFEEDIQAVGCKTYFYGLVFDEIKKIKLLAPCDYAFNMMKSEVNVGLTTKSIDYLSYGLPLINNIKGDTWKMVEKEKVGINVSNIGEFKLCFNAQSRKHILNTFSSYFEKKSFEKMVTLCLTTDSNKGECECI